MFFRIPEINPISECIHKYNKLALKKKQVQQVQCCFIENQTKQQAQLAVKGARRITTAQEAACWPHETNPRTGEAAIKSH